MPEAFDPRPPTRRVTIQQVERRWINKVLMWSLGVIGAGTLFIIGLVWKHDGQINELDKSKGVVEEKLKNIDSTQTEMKTDLKEIKREIFRRNP